MYYGPYREMKDPSEKYRQYILDTCTRCGMCVRLCPGIEIARLRAIPPAEIQSSLYDFLKEARYNPIAAQRIDSCLECFQCVDSCPAGINPLSFIETAKEISSRCGYTPYSERVPDDFSSHLRSINQDLDEKQRGEILNISGRKGSRYLFFPGCNVYNEAARLLKIKFILKTISEDITFIPGIEYCCGDRYRFDGRLAEAHRQNKRLTDVIGQYKPDTVILWCPTCLSRFAGDGNSNGGNGNVYVSENSSDSNSRTRYISFFQFCLEHIDSLNFSGCAAPRAVTLHEPCKTAYRKLDESHRDILRRMPGIELREMDTEIMCCGSGGTAHYRDRTIGTMTLRRLEEARRTGAESLITVCHYCQELFESVNPHRELEVLNLADLMYDLLVKEPAQARGVTEEA